MSSLSQSDIKNKSPENPDVKFETQNIELAPVNITEESFSPLVSVVSFLDKFKRSFSNPHNNSKSVSGNINVPRAPNEIFHRTFTRNVISYLKKEFPQVSSDSLWKGFALDNASKDGVVHYKGIREFLKEFHHRSDSNSFLDKIVNSIEFVFKPRHQEPSDIAFGQSINTNIIPLLSYPTNETRLVRRSIEYFTPKLISKAAQEICDTMEAEDKNFTAVIEHKKLFNLLERTVDKLVREVWAVSINEISFQEKEELIAQLYSAVFRESCARGLVKKVNIEWAFTGVRDGDQSNFGNSLVGAIRRRLVESVVDTGINFSYLETWGGAVPQTDILKRTRGDKPEDPFYNLIQQTNLLRRKLEEVIGTKKENRYNLDQGSLDKLYSKYDLNIKEAKERVVLKPEELEEIIVKMKSCSNDVKSEVRRVYGLHQSMLFRGMYTISLKLLPPKRVREVVQLSKKYGVDIIRVFDSLNLERNMFAGIDEAKKVGALIQPVIHYAPNSALWKEKKFVDMAFRLQELAGDRFHGLVLKDAGGMLTREDAYEFVKTLRDAGFKGRIIIHTHETRGNQLLTLLEAIRANGGTENITLDLGASDLGPPMGQVDAISIARVTHESPWAVEAKENGLVKLAQFSSYLRSILPSKLNYPGFSTLQRILFAKVGLPGGMSTNFEAQLIDQLSKGLARGLIKPKFNIDVISESGELTKNDGRAFMDEFLRLIAEEMDNMNKDLGGICHVTPTSQWVGGLAFQNILMWLQKGWIIKGVAEGKKLHLEVKLPEENCGAARYLAFSGDVKGYLVEWLVEDFIQSGYRGIGLKELYPNVHRDLLYQAMISVLKTSKTELTENDQINIKEAILGDAYKKVARLQHSYEETVKYYKAREERIFKSSVQEGIANKQIQDLEKEILNSKEFFLKNREDIFRDSEINFELLVNILGKYSDCFTPQSSPTDEELIKKYPTIKTETDLALAFLYDDPSQFGNLEEARLRNLEILENGAGIQRNKAEERLATVLSYKV